MQLKQKTFHSEPENKQKDYWNRILSFYQAKHCLQQIYFSLYAKKYIGKPLRYVEFQTDTS